MGLEILLVAVPWAAIVAGLLYTFREERQSWIRERSELLNRIQAPERLPMPTEPVVVMDRFIPEDDTPLNMVGQIVTGDSLEDDA